MSLFSSGGFRSSIKKSYLQTSISLFTVILISGCGSQVENTLNDGQPLVQKTEIRSLDYDKPSVAPGESVSADIQVAITVDRESILKQEFLYGADLQYSSSYTPELDLYQQSMAIGHIPARFRIVGNELQLVADNKRLYASSVNHPEQLLSRYKILSQTEASPATLTEAAKPATLTISGANSKLILSEIFAGATIGTLRGSHTNSEDGVTPRDFWIRSFEYVAKGNYLLQETSVVMADGSIAEFMESVFPRSTLNPGVDFESFEMDPDDEIGAKKGPVHRYRMLSGEKNFKGEKAVSYAQHFDISPKADGSAGTIDYYATRNIPDEFIEPVKLAIEGWNRYFVKMDGVARPVMQFKGKLPEGIHLGDPRYNVVNWDSREKAGAAYESQASDPATGRQSHSLIYMPAAWLFIGDKYWKNGQYSDAKDNNGQAVPTTVEEFLARQDRESQIGSVSASALSSMGGTLRSAHVACFRELADGAGLIQSGRLNAEENTVFGIQLLKQTLFHEVGHSLGLGHNFKGSLKYTYGEPNSLFSDSIMDYNDFELERQAFDGIHSSNGPLLEYDRQVISAIYNKGKDVKATDPVLVACADEEADSERGGVDPLCNRYDLENDPTSSVFTALSRIAQKELPGDITLAQALDRIATAKITPEEIAAIKTDEDLNAFVKELTDSVKGSMSFYIVDAKSSLAKVVITNLKSLLQFKDGILPDDYSEGDMRSRAMSGAQWAANLYNLPPATVDAVNQVAKKAIVAVSQSPLFKSLKKEDKNSHMKDLLTQIMGSVVEFESDSQHGLPKLREAVLASLHRHARAPFFLGDLATSQATPEGKVVIVVKQADFEGQILELLGNAVQDKSRSEGERIYAALSLMSFKNRSTTGDQIIKNARDAIVVERDKAASNDSRELSALLVQILRLF